MLGSRCGFIKFLFGNLSLGETLARPYVYVNVTVTLLGALFRAIPAIYALLHLNKSRKCYKLQEISSRTFRQFVAEITFSNSPETSKNYRLLLNFRGKKKQHRHFILISK